MSDVAIGTLNTALWTVYRGKDASLVCVMQTNLGASAVASGTVFKCTFRAANGDASPALIDLTMGSGIAADSGTGTVTLTLTDTQTAARTAGVLLYGQLWRDDSGVKQPIFEIELTVLERTTSI